MQVVARVVGDVARDGASRVVAQRAVFFGDVDGVRHRTNQRQVVAARAADADVVVIKVQRRAGVTGADGVAVHVVVRRARGEVAVVRAEAGAAVDAVVVGDEGARAAMDGVWHGVAGKAAALTAHRADGVMQRGFGDERGLPAAAMDDGGVFAEVAQAGQRRLPLFDIGVVGERREQRGQADDAAARVVQRRRVALQFGVVQELRVQHRLLAAALAVICRVAVNAAGVVDVARVLMQRAHGVVPSGDLVGAVRRRFAVRVEVGHGDGHGACRRVRVAVVQHDVAATFGERARGGAARDARADDSDAPGCGGGGVGPVRLARGRGGEGGGNHVAFRAVAGDFFHLESGLREGIAHAARGAEGGGSRARHAVTGDFGDEFRRPAFGVFRRGKAVEIPGVHLRAQLRQGGADVAQDEVQMDARMHFEQVVAGMVVRVLCEDGGADFRLRPVALQGGEGFGGDGVAFKTDVVQPCVCWGFAEEGVGGVDEVQPGAVADFADGEAAGMGNARVQAVAVDEDVLAFGKTRTGVVIDVVVVVAAGLAVGVEGEVGVIKKHGGVSVGVYIQDSGEGVCKWYRHQGQQCILWILCL